MALVLFSFTFLVLVLAIADFGTSQNRDQWTSL